MRKLLDVRKFNGFYSKHTYSLQNADSFNGSCIIRAGEEMTIDKSIYIQYI